MPLVVRQALSTRLSAMPELRLFLADIERVAGLTVRFWPSVPVASELGGSDSDQEPAGLCARMAREPGGCRMCVSFRQKLRERAADTEAEAKCDAGLIEMLVREAIDTTKALNRARHLLARLGVEWSGAELARLQAASPECSAERRAALARVLRAGAEKIGRTMSENLVAAPNGVPALVDRAYLIVHAEYARTLRVPTLARRLGVSAAHLSRVFHHATGLRLVDYVARYRAERARMLLAEDSARPVAKVAEACGFASISQFNRVFKTTFGASPRSFRTRSVTIP
jgi:AraC-like DNA-binding protein